MEESLAQLAREIARVRLRLQSTDRGQSKSTLTSINGSTYAGVISKPKRGKGSPQPFGFGKCLFSNEDNPLIASYDGGWKEGKCHGDGIITLRSFPYMEGEIVCYEGIWAEGVLQKATKLTFDK